MMFCLVVVSALVAVSSANPLPCCMPDQFSGLLQQLGGAIGTNETQGHVMDDWMELHYDYVNGKQLVISHARDENTGVRGNTTILYNYRESRMHVVTADGQCHTDPLDPNSMYDPCMLKDFAYGDSYTIGSSKNQFQINTWEGFIGKARFGMAVTADQHCYPVADQLYGSDATGSAVYAYFFMNITTTNLDRNIFDLPTACKSTAISTGVGKRDLEVLGVKRRPMSYV